MPGRSGLAGSTAEAVARGLGRAQSSSRQPLPGLRPLGLRMEVGHPFIRLPEPLGLCLIFGPQIFAILLFHHLIEFKFSNGHRISCHSYPLDSAFEFKLSSIILSDPYPLMDP